MMGGTDKQRSICGIKHQENGEKRLREKGEWRKVES